MVQPCIEIVADGGPQIGFGHLSRCRALAAALRAAGIGVRVTRISDFARAWDGFGPDDDGNVVLTLVDLPVCGDRWIDGARAKGRKTIGLDYIGEAAPDVAIALSPAAEPVPAGVFLKGLDYAIVRPDIRNAARGQGRHVLVVVGGSDARDQGPAAAAALGRKGADVVLVRGPLAQAVAPGPYEAKIDPPDLPALMARCAWAVCNAGTTVVELMSLGRAAHILPQSDAEARFAESLAAAGLILGIGLDTLTVPAPARIATVGQAAASAVDGRGTERIVGIVRRLIV